MGNRYVITRTTNCLDVPLLVSFKPTRGLTILAGPQYSYLLSQNNKFDNSESSVDQEQVFDNENLRNNMFCLTGGVDVNIKYLVLSGRAGWDMLKNNGDGTTTTPRYKNLWYQFTLGYRFL